MLIRATTVRRVAQLVLLPGLAFGCSSGGGGSVEPHIEVAASPPGPGDEVTMPLEAYDFDEESNELFDAAEEHEVRSCMRAAGFDYHPLEQSATAEIALEQRPETFDQYGITSDADAARYGYRGVATAAAAARDPNQPSLTQQYGIDYVIALVGEQVIKPEAEGLPPGCAGQAAATVAGPAGGDEAGEILGQLWLKAAGLAAEDSRVVETIEAWSQCMRGRGRDFATPRDAVEHHMRGVELTRGPDAIAPASAEEIDTARDDAACKDEVNLVGVWVAVEIAYQEELIAQEPEALESYTAWRDGQVEHVRGLLAED